MALISKKHKFLFIHIPRTGGSTIHRLFDKDLTILDLIIRPFQHSTLKKTLWDYAEFSSFYKFAYVRCPYDWLVSLYFHIRQTNTHPDFTIVNSQSFSDFIVWLEEVGLNRPETGEKPFYRTQTDYINLHGKINVDYVYRFEDLCDDMGTSNVSSLFMKLDLKIPEHVPVTNRSERILSWQGIYDAPTYKLVNKLFAEDFKNFKYQMYTL